MRGWGEKRLRGNGNSSTCSGAWRKRHWATGTTPPDSGSKARQGVTVMYRSGFNAAIVQRPPHVYKPFTTFQLLTIAPHLLPWCHNSRGHLSPWHSTKTMSNPLRTNLSTMSLMIAMKLRIETTRSCARCCTTRDLLLRRLGRWEGPRNATVTYSLSKLGGEQSV